MPKPEGVFAELDQRLDRLPYKQVAGGSSPSLRTKISRQQTANSRQFQGLNF